MDFEQFVRRATRTPERPEGFEPYHYQRRLAAQGHPELLRVPTGAGKTAAAVLPWLWRRQNTETRDATPRRLVFTLPMRTLVEQTFRDISHWLGNLGLSGSRGPDGVGLHRLIGGAGKIDGSWRHDPDRDAVLVGTLDQTLSRALNRGYGVSRFCWPVDFGLLHSDTLWVFDEVQLMGPALPTSLQLEAFRSAEGWGTLRPCRSMWMSATVDDDQLVTVDRPAAPTGDAVVELSEADRSGPLASRLGATRLVREVHPGDDEATRLRKLAHLLVDLHAPGTRTLAVVNTVARARSLAAAVREVTASQATHETSGQPQQTPDQVPVLVPVLVHSRFRPADRSTIIDRAAAKPDEAGTIIVSTQVLEAGVDLSARILLTESAPWPSVVQRAGRCNRDGGFNSDGGVTDAQLLWFASPREPGQRSGPYSGADLDAAEKTLRRAEKQILTTEEINSIPIRPGRPAHPVLRRRDLLSLFDTTPDLAGNDIDISRFLRDSDDLDVSVGWLDLPDGKPPAPDVRPPLAEWLCPVPVREVRDLLRRDRPIWRFDAVDGRWVRCLQRDQVRPGQVLVMPASAGCYSPEGGWDPTVRTCVPVHDGSDSGPGRSRPDGSAPSRDGHDPLAGVAEPVDDGAATCAAPRWVSLRDHAADVEERARALAEGLPDRWRQAVAVAGRLHDIGKAHDEGFQRMLVGADDRPNPPPREGGPWAKSPSPRRSRNLTRPYFRHELASALALLGDGHPALAGVAEPDLVIYLVAAHHGRVRLGVRSMPGERQGRVLGIEPGDTLDAIDLANGQVPAAKLNLSLLDLGQGDGGPSWTARALALRDRPDLGPFRLATLEALVRMADWAASRNPGRGTRGTNSTNAVVPSQADAGVA